MPVSILTLIDKIIIPTIEGNNKITTIGENLYFSNKLNIKLDKPNENKIEKK